MSSQWAEYENEDGHKYYHNASTGETAWDKPAALSGPLRRHFYRKAELADDERVALEAQKMRALDSGGGHLEALKKRIKIALQKQHFVSRGLRSPQVHLMSGTKRATAECGATRAHFDTFDGDDSGDLDLGEFVAALRSILGAPLPPFHGMSEVAQLEALFHALDTNRDGSVCFDELSLFLHRQAHEQQVASANCHVLEHELPEPAPHMARVHTEQGGAARTARKQAVALFSGMAEPAPDLGGPKLGRVYTAAEEATGAPVPPLRSAEEQGQIDGSIAVTRAARTRKQQERNREKLAAGVERAETRAQAASEALQQAERELERAARLAARELAPVVKVWKARYETFAGTNCSLVGVAVVERTGENPDDLLNGGLHRPDPMTLAMRPVYAPSARCCGCCESCRTVFKYSAAADRQLLDKEAEVRKQLESAAHNVDWKKRADEQAQGSLARAVSARLAAQPGAAPSAARVRRRSVLSSAKLRELDPQREHLEALKTRIKVSLQKTKTHRAGHGRAHDDEECGTVRVQFDAFDGDGNGELDIDEFVAALRSILGASLQPFHGMSEVAQLEALFAALDTNRDGVVDYDELSTFLRSRSGSEGVA